MNFIRRAREALEMSQTEFANALGLTQTSVSRYETGLSTPRQPTRMAVEALLAKHGKSVTE
jgi:transcriptional regulator with XRE-family HTH domain